MIHASPFFESILTGEWAETTVFNSPTDPHPEHSSSSTSESLPWSTPHLNPSTPKKPSNHLLTQYPPINPHGYHHQEPSNVDDNLDHSSSHNHRPIEPITTHDPINPSTSDSSHPSILPRATILHQSIPTQDEPEQDSSTSSGDQSSILRLIQSPSNHPFELHSSKPPSNPSPPLKPQHLKSFDSITPFVQQSPLGPPTTDPITNKSKPKNSPIEARIDLKEERPASFQDLLMFVYPHLECVCTWHNASDLMTMSQKFDMPLLKRHVLSFLLSSVAGKPIEAMRIAEEHQLPELYRESSRFLLDNWQGWDTKELENLSSQTLLKLEKRRTWFLERLLKLGLVNTSRDYVCPSSCPDPQHCSRLVDDKWKSAWGASFKFGPPQPSSVYRALRCLEPSLHSPALLLPHTSCQQHALRFFADLFDRMFSQFTPRGGGGVAALNGGGLSTNGIISNGLNSSSNHGSNPATSNQNILGLGASDQNPVSNHHNNLGPASTGLGGNGNSNNNGLSGFATMNSGMSHILNGDKTIRKAKYFLHVELFENNHEKLRKRFD